MRFLQNHSIRRKQMLIIMLTSTMTLLLACAAFVAYDAVTFRRELSKSVSVLAEAIGNNCAAAIDFNDPKAAEETLAALHANNNIVSACIFARDGHVLAVYQRDPTATFVPPSVREPVQEFTVDRLHLFSAIKQQGEMTGTIYVSSDLKALPTRFVRYLGIVGLVFLASVLVAFVLSTQLQRLICDPILHLARIAKSVAVEKNYSQRAQKHSNDELGLLVDGFNEMLAQIQARDIALQTTRDEAEKANHAKSEFLSRMSHELRTPLNAVLGFAQLVEMDELSTDQHEAMGHILRGGDHLLDLINEVLDLACIEAGRMSFSLEPVEIDDVLREILVMMAPLALGRDIRLHPPGCCGFCLLADPQRLRQVLINLVSNSIKYNRPGGSVTVTCEQSNDRARILVHDTGIGIPAERVSELFTPFERLGAEQTAVEGTGLGLAIAKRLVEGMHGLIEVQSVPGKGTTFLLEFPIAESPRIRALSATEAEAPALTAPRERRRILYIEDNLSNFRLVEQVLLRRPEIELLGAHVGTEGLKLAGQYLPDLILLDLNLPDIDGHEVLTELQKNPRCVGIPVVVISADATHRQEQRLTAAGAAAYLTKPLNIKLFLEVVDRCLDEAKQDR